MRRKLYGNSIQPACEICALGQKNSRGDAVLCPRKGVTPLYFSCRRFSYDPLKRVPRRTPLPGGFTKKDFEL